MGGVLLRTRHFHADASAHFKGGNPNGKENTGTRKLPDAHRR